MRNWNRIADWMRVSYFLVESLPMRNWNREKEKIFEVLYVLNLYLWGIETFPSPRFSRDLPLLNLYLWGIETNLTVENGVTPDGWIFTYEELKLHSVWRGRHRRQKLNLYLWGIETSPSRRRTAAVSSLNLYLWGIETASPNTQRSESTTLNLYLWGIETYLI